jgi:hypothetical protein
MVFGIFGGCPPYRGYFFVLSLVFDKAYRLAAILPVQTPNFYKKPLARNTIAFIL